MLGEAELRELARGIRRRGFLHPVEPHVNGMAVRNCPKRRMPDLFLNAFRFRGEEQ
jgi:hypothetical protein